MLMQCNGSKNGAFYHASLYSYQYKLVAKYSQKQLVWGHDLHNAFLTAPIETTVINLEEALCTIPTERLDLFACLLIF